MSRYTFLVGKRVEAHYRAADVHLSAVGLLVADSGRSICIEERFHEAGRNKVIRVEIPYEYILRISEAESGSSL